MHDSHHALGANFNFGRPHGERHAARRRERRRDSSPFPASSRVTLSMRAAEVEVRTQGVVRIMHPEKGMGVELTNYAQHRASVEKFLGILTGNRTLSPELLVEPDGLETVSTAKPLPADADDPLLQLFYGESLTPEQFHEALRNQRATPTAAGAHAKKHLCHLF